MRPMAWVTTAILPLSDPAGWSSIAWLLLNTTIGAVSPPAGVGDEFPRPRIASLCGVGPTTSAVPAYRSALHETRAAAWLGVGLGVTFGLCFATGVWSHLAQDPPSWFTYPARPAGLYRITQGVHVASGYAAAC